MDNQVKYARAQKVVKARMGFYIHLVIYLLVNVGLAAINLATSPTNLWFKWPLLGWGIGICFHLLLLLLIPKGPGVKQRMIEKEMKKGAY